MALGAMADHPEVKVKIVPVGLSYFHPHRFRSRAVVEFGTAPDVPPELVEEYKQGGAQKRDAVGKLLNLIYDGLKTVTIRAPDYETLMVLRYLSLDCGDVIDTALPGSSFRRLAGCTRRLASTSRSVRLSS